MSRFVIAAWIPGQPKTKGSMTARPNGSMRENVVGSSRWKAAMKSVLESTAARMPLFAMVEAGKAIRVDMTAYLSRPPGETGAHAFPCAGRIGDLDKLVRNLLDAGTEARVWADDVQVTDFGHTKKRWATERGPGIQVLVYELGDEDL